MKKVILKAGKEAAIRRYHPWVFSGAIQHIEGETEDGDLVEVFSKNGQYLATGHYQAGSIMVRIFSFRQTNAGQDFWNEKLGAAYRYRQLLGLTGHPHTNCYRLVHAEGDGLPGLIIDMYGSTAVIQCHSIGMHRQRAQITTALQSVYNGTLQAIYDKSAESLPRNYAGKQENQYLFGQKTNEPVRENGFTFYIDWETGQKTGFFLDQRENRQLVGLYAEGKTVLNAFSYTGGFSIYALGKGARQVDSVDVSAKAIDLAGQNVLLNFGATTHHQAHAEEVLRFLKDCEPKYDLMIVDPPAFAKNIGKRHNAVQGYKRLNALALQKIRPGGILFTFSCSQVVDRSLFESTIVAAALEAGKEVKVMHHLSQAADHPANLFHPEGSYLKGLAVYVV